MLMQLWEAAAAAAVCICMCIIRESAPAAAAVAARRRYGGIPPSLSAPRRAECCILSVWKLRARELRRAFSSVFFCCCVVFSKMLGAGW